MDVINVVSTFVTAISIGLLIWQFHIRRTAEIAAKTALQAAWSSYNSIMGQAEDFWDPDLRDRQDPSERIAAAEATIKSMHTTADKAKDTIRGTMGLVGFSDPRRSAYDRPKETDDAARS